MKKTITALIALMTLLIPASAYADVAYPGTVNAFGSRFNIIPLILIVALIFIALAIIFWFIKRRK